MLCVKPSVRKTCAENFLCKNHLPIIIAVHLKNQSVKASVRKSFCCVKTVLGKVSACKKSRMYFFWRSLCLFFQCQKNCVKTVLCKGFSVAKVLCAKMPTCLYLCAQRHLCIKHRYVKTSLCKNLCVQRCLCTKVSLCTNLSV